MLALLVQIASCLVLERTTPQLWVKDQAATISYYITIDEENQLTLKDEFTTEIYYNIDHSQTYSVDLALDIDPYTCK